MRSTSGIGPVGIDLDSKSDQVYVADNVSNTVSVVNASSNEVVQSLRAWPHRTPSRWIRQRAGCTSRTATGTT